MNTLITYHHYVLLVILLLGLSACAGRDKKDKTPDAMTEKFREMILNTVTYPERAEMAAKPAR